jgi:hypothetical protein
LCELAKRDFHEHDRSEVGKEREGQPFQNGDIACILQEYLKTCADDRKKHNVNCGLAPDEETNGIAHRAKVGTDVDDIGYKQKHDDEWQQPCRVMLAQIGGYAVPSRATDPGANFLDRGHQRIAEEHRPGDGKSKLRSGLGVSRNPARIIVCRSGNQAGAKHIEQAWL